MPFDASGTFTRLRGADSWKGDAAAGTPVKSDLHDTNDNDLAAGLTGCITKDGRSQPTADIPFNTRKIINLGQPTAPQDAATKRYVDEMPGWPTAKYISGADVNGRLNFTSSTGANGITWSNIGAAWLARIGVANQERSRVVLNNNVDGSGTDVIAISEADGSIAVPAQFETSQNLIFDGTSWRTPTAGTGGIMRKTALALTMLANSVATTLAYGVATLETWFTIARGGGSVSMIFNKKAATDTIAVYGQMNGVNRWQMQLGNANAEDASNDGSYFYLTSFTNAGASNYTLMWGSRKDGKMRFPQGFAGAVVTDDYFNAKGIYGDTTLIVAATNNNILIRPIAYNNTAQQSIFNNTGDLVLARYMICNGYAECAGTGGVPNNGQIFNFDYVDSTHINVYVGTTLVGTITPACDHRIKKDIAPLPSTWAAVKNLRPIKYSKADFGSEGLFVADDIEHWGFLAHELQEALTPTAASGEMDGPQLQTPDHITIIAALTAALQEAMLRIEALETERAV